MTRTQHDTSSYCRASALDTAARTIVCLIVSVAKCLDPKRVDKSLNTK